MYFLGILGSVKIKFGQILEQLKKNVSKLFFAQL